MSESMIQMQRKLADVTSKLEKAERELAEAQATLARLAQQEPVAWMREDGNLYLAWQKDLCLPEVRFSPLYAAPVPAVAAGLPAIGPYRDFIPAPAVPTDEQIHAAYREALGQSIRERDMPEIRKFARRYLALRENGVLMGMPHNMTLAHDEKLDAAADRLLDGGE